MYSPYIILMRKNTLFYSRLYGLYFHFLLFVPTGTVPFVYRLEAVSFLPIINLYTVSFMYGGKKRTLIFMSYLCFKGRMMEKIFFGWINNCQKNRASLLPKGYMCWKNQHQSYTGISSMTVIYRVPFEGFIIKTHCSSTRYVNIESVINITWIWIHTGSGKFYWD